MPHEFKDDTLGDIKARDIDNLEHVLKNRTTHYFEGLAEASMFQNRALFTILARLGMDLKKTGFDEKEIDRLLEKNNIRVEHRQYEDTEEDKDKWRSGIYIYKDNEIVEFIGSPHTNPFSHLSGQFWQCFTSFKSIEKAGEHKIFSLT